MTRVWDMRDPTNLVVYAATPSCHLAVTRETCSDRTQISHSTILCLCVFLTACKQYIGLPPYGKISASSVKNADEGSSCTAEDGFIMTNKGWCSRKSDCKLHVQLSQRTYRTATFSNLITCMSLKS